MDSLLSKVLARAYSDLIVSGASVTIYAGHFRAAVRALDALRDLHDVRVTSINTIDGILRVATSVDYGDDVLTEIMTVTIGGTNDRVAEIVRDARTLSAWSCAVDGQPGWMVSTPTGTKPLCPKCQARIGVGGQRYEA